MGLSRIVESFQNPDHVPLWHCLELMHSPHFFSRAVKQGVGLKILNYRQNCCMHSPYYVPRQEMSGLEASRQAHGNIPRGVKQLNQHKGNLCGQPIRYGLYHPFIFILPMVQGLSFCALYGLLPMSFTSSHTRSKQNSWMGEAVEDSWRPAPQQRHWLVASTGGTMGPLFFTLSVRRSLKVLQMH